MAAGDPSTSCSPTAATIRSLVHENASSVELDDHLALDEGGHLESSASFANIYLPSIWSSSLNPALSLSYPRSSSEPRLTWFDDPRLERGGKEGEGEGERAVKGGKANLSNRPFSYGYTSPSDSTFSGDSTLRGSLKSRKDRRSMWRTSLSSLLPGVLDGRSKKGHQQLSDDDGERDGDVHAAATTTMQVQEGAAEAAKKMRKKSFRSKGGSKLVKRTDGSAHVQAKDRDKLKGGEQASGADEGLSLVLGDIDFGSPFNEGGQAEGAVQHAFSTITPNVEVPEGLSAFSQAQEELPLPTTVDPSTTTEQGPVSPSISFTSLLSSPSMTTNLAAIDPLKDGCGSNGLSTTYTLPSNGAVDTNGGKAGWRPGLSLTDLPRTGSLLFSKRKPKRPSTASASASASAAVRKGHGHHRSVDLSSQPATTPATVGAKKDYAWIPSAANGKPFALSIDHLVHSPSSSFVPASPESPAAKKKQLLEEKPLLRRHTASAHSLPQPPPPTTTTSASTSMSTINGADQDADDSTLPSINSDSWPAPPFRRFTMTAPSSVALFGGAQPAFVPEQRRHSWMDFGSIRLGSRTSGSSFTSYNNANAAGVSASISADGHAAFEDIAPVPASPLPRTPSQRRLANARKKSLSFLRKLGPGGGSGDVDAGAQLTAAATTNPSANGVALVFPPAEIDDDEADPFRASRSSVQLIKSREEIVVAAPSPADDTTDSREEGQPTEEGVHVEPSLPRPGQRMTVRQEALCVITSDAPYAVSAIGAKAKTIVNTNANANQKGDGADDGATRRRASADDAGASARDSRPGRGDRAPMDRSRSQSPTPVFDKLLFVSSQMGSNDTSRSSSPAASPSPGLASDGRVYVETEGAPRERQDTLSASSGMEQLLQQQVQLCSFLPVYGCSVSPASSPVNTNSDLPSELSTLASVAMTPSSSSSSSSSNPYLDLQQHRQRSVSPSSRSDLIASLIAQNAALVEGRPSPSSTSGNGGGTSSPVQLYHHLSSARGREDFSPSGTPSPCKAEENFNGAGDYWSDHSRAYAAQVYRLQQAQQRQQPQQRERNHFPGDSEMSREEDVRRWEEEDEEEEGGDEEDDDDDDDDIDFDEVTLSEPASPTTLTAHNLQNNNNVHVAAPIRRHSPGYEPEPLSEILEEDEEE